MSRTALARALIAAMALMLPQMVAGSIAGEAGAVPGGYLPADPPDTPDQPDAPGPPGAPGVTLAWPALGLDPEMYLSPDSASSFTIPLPTGLSAARVQGLIHQPMNINAGILEVDDADGNFLGAVDLPPAATAQPVTPFDLDISAARARSSSIDLSFTVRARDTSNEVCGPLQQVVLSDIATVFTGIEPPATTIASFFPPVLERVNIYAPADASATEQQSVLALVSTLPRLYYPRPLAISVINQPRGAAPPPAPQLTRAILVEGGAAGLAVENAGTPEVFLRVSGKGDELSAQVSLLANQLQTLAQAATSRVDQAGSEASISGDTVTFGQMKMSGKTNVLRTSTMTVGVDRSALGAGRIDSAKIHLLADYTPVPRDDAASVLIRSNGIVVYRAALDNTGSMDATFTLERRTFSQWINLDFTFTYTPHDACNPLTAPVTFQIDPRSTLTIRRGGPPLGGFGAFPSEFSPTFVVAFDGSSPNQLVYAARIVAAIARLTESQLTPRVVDLKTAADAKTGALIVANSAAIKQTSLDPPLSGDGTAVDVALPTELRANIDGGIGSIQAFADLPRNRSVVLVTTTGAWTLVDPLFDYIDGLKGGWPELAGDLLAAGAGGVPTNLAIRADSTTADTFVPPQSRSSNRWILVGVGVAVAAAVALAIAAVMVRLRRRRRTTWSDPDDEVVTTPDRDA